MTDKHPNLQVSPATRGGESLADILERVLDKGLVIAGDVRINLLDIELLTLKIRLLVASADKAREMGIDWWIHDPHLSSTARQQHEQTRNLQQENDRLRQRLEKLESDLQHVMALSGATPNVATMAIDENRDG